MVVVEKSKFAPARHMPASYMPARLAVANRVYLIAPIDYIVRRVFYEIQCIIMPHSFSYFMNGAKYGIIGQRRKVFIGIIHTLASG
jgi:hypothetical protein